MNVNENIIYELELTADQLQYIFNVSHMALYRWRKEGMPFIRDGGKVRYKLADVEEWLNSQNARVTVRR